MDKNASNVAIILLAAGSSSRMGKSKQLLQVMGEPMLLRSAREAVASGADPVVIVLGAGEKEHEKIVDRLPLTVVFNRHWQKGIGNSIKAGLDSLLAFAPETKAAVIMVCDQPLITASHLRSLIQKYAETDDKIVASFYSGTVGVPVLFDKSLFQDLLALDDDHGAKKILNKYPQSIATIHFEGGEIDLDTDSEYRAFLQRKNQNSSHE